MKKSCEIFLENRGTYTNGELTHTLETNIIDRVTQMNLCIPCCRYFCEVVLYNAVFSYDFLLQKLIIKFNFIMYFIL